MCDIEQIVYVGGSSKIAKDFKVGVIKAMFSSYKSQIAIMRKVRMRSARLPFPYNFP